MLSIPDDAIIFLHGRPIDLRNGFDGLSYLAHTIFKNEMIPNTFFVFFNPRRTRIKILHWNGDNLSIWYLRLRKGVFFPPACLMSLQINKQELQMILNRQPPKHLLIIQNSP